MRTRKDLITVKLPAEHVRTAEHQIEAIVRFHIVKFTAYLPMLDQMKSLAFDCYTQGLLDGTAVMDMKEPRE
jgi:hypothetical protein